MYTYPSPYLTSGAIPPNGNYIPVQGYTHQPIYQQHQHQVMGVNASPISQNSAPIYFVPQVVTSPYQQTYHAGNTFHQYGSHHILEMFSGLGFNESAVEFFRKITTHPQIISATTEDDKIKIVGGYLVDSARKWFQQQNWSNHTLVTGTTTETNVVGSFQNRFLLKYMTPEKQAFLEREFWQRQQGENESAYSYYRDKLRLYERCTLDTSDVKFISHVVNGLTRLYADMYLGGPPSTLDGLVQGLTNADHRYYGIPSMQMHHNNVLQPVCNMQATVVGQPQVLNQTRVQEINQVKVQDGDNEKADSIDQIADKLFSKMDALVEKKLEQKLANQNFTYRRNMQPQSRSSEGYRNEVSQPMQQPRQNNSERNERRPTGPTEARPNRGCFNCGSLDHRQYDCRNPCGKCGGDHVSRVCQQVRQPSGRPHGSSNSIVATREDDYEDNSYYDYPQQQDFQSGYHM